MERKTANSEHGSIAYTVTGVADGEVRDRQAKGPTARLTLIRRAAAIAAVIVLTPINGVSSGVLAQENLAPTADAGPDQVLTVADPAFLLGLMGDDGLPDPAAVPHASWTVSSGPGAVEFARADEVMTSATFGAAGTYVLRLTVDDGITSTSDETVITVLNGAPNTIRVPDDYPTIQAAVDAAQQGDLVLVAPGTYNEDVYISKTITLASTYYTTADPAFIDQTIISATNDLAQTVTFAGGAGREARIVGFTVQDGQDGVKIRGNASVIGNRFVNLATDAVDFNRDAAGMVLDNTMEGNGDDGVDIDDSSVLIRGNDIRLNDGDGVEIRTLDAGDSFLTITIRDNVMTDNSDDGIQIIDDDTVGDTNALLIVDHNLIARNALAGIGFMDLGETTEDYRAASLSERVHVFNNTLIGNNHGLTGGDNVVAINNIFMDHTNIAVKETDGNSVVANSLFWNNGVDQSGSNVDTTSTVNADPQLDEAYQLLPLSPAIDAGTARYVLSSGEVVLDLSPSSYSGPAPDIGRNESNFDSGGNLPPTVDAGPDLSLSLPALSADLDATVDDDDMPDPPGTTTVLWSQAGGPAGVIFGNATMADTTATFPGPGDYVLRLTASDSVYSISDSVNVSVVDPFVTSVDVRVGARADDAEEDLSGSVDLGSSDLELGSDSGTDQLVGMRFPGVDVPAGATVTSATIQFQVDETDTGTTTLGISGQAVDDAQPFSSANGDVSSRALTSAFVPWTPDAWSVTGEAEQTPDLSSVLQEIVDRSGWASGNAIVVVMSGSGERTAESYDGDPLGAPLLHVEFSAEPPVANDPPVAGDDAVDTSEDVAVVFDVVGNDTDADGNLDPSTVNTGCVGCSQPENGSLVNHSDGTFTYLPSTDFNGGDGFTYSVCDDLGACDRAVVAITVDAVNDAPVAVDDIATTSEDVAAVIGVVANDTDVDGDDLVVSTLGLAANGVVLDNGNGTVTYTPGPGFTGNDSFIYSASDGTDDSGTATVTVTVTITNAPPVAVDDVTTTTEDNSVVVNVTFNDTDDDDNLDPATTNTSCAGCAEPSNGTLTNDNDGTFTYTPADDFNGTDSFTYEVCDTLDLCATATATVTVEAVNDAPTANDDNAATNQDQAVTIDLLANDDDIDGDQLTVTNLTSPANGTVINNNDGSITYTPDAAHTGADTLTYTANDSTTDSATATVTVTTAPTAPQSVEAQVASGSDDAEERASGSVSLTSSDLELTTDGSRGAQTVGLRFAGLEIPAGATVTSAWIQFQADETKSGDAVLTIAGQAVDNATTFANTSGNISSRQLTNSSAVWTPPAWTSVGASGPGQQTSDLAAIVQEITQRPGWVSGNAMAFVVVGTGTRTAESYNGNSTGAPTLHVEFTTVPQPNRPPAATNDTLLTEVDTAATIDVAANDLDPDNNIDPASANTDCTTCRLASNGLLENFGSGTFRYTPDSGFIGSDSFTYEICDDEGLCSTGITTITVSAAAPRVIDVRVAASADDAEERLSGTVSLTSSDLELVVDGSKGTQAVGMRFADVELPAGALVTTAWVQFTADETSDANAELLIRGQSADSAASFTNAKFDLTSRPLTQSGVSWSVSPWPDRGEAGTAQRTPNLATVIQEIAERSGWQSGNSLVLLITGDGTRTAESYNGAQDSAPLLHVEYTLP